MEALAHKLAGAAGTHGFSEMSEKARDVEILCSELIAADGTPTAEDRNEIRGLLTVIRETREGDPRLALTKMSVWPDHKDRRGERKLVLIDDEEDYARILGEQIKPYGFSLIWAKDPKELSGILSTNRVSLVLMDMMIEGDEDSGLRGIEQLRSRGELNCPVVFLSVRSDFQARLGAARAGCDGYLVKPFDPRELVFLIERVVYEPIENPYRVLVIDDDPDIAIYNKTLLEGAGAICEIETNPHRGLTALRAFSPDVVLMDVNMPACSGFELASVIRQFPQFIDTPIVFLTAEGGITRRISGIQSGGDEFLEKAADADILVAAVLSRAKRARELGFLVDGLKRSEERFQSSLNFANVGVWDWYIDTGQLLWTERVAPMFGYPVGELETTYENFMQAVHPDDRETVDNAVRACIDRGDAYDIEHRVAWPDGTVKWVTERGDVIRNEHGKPVRMLGVIRDISRRKEAELAFAESRAALQDAQRLAHMGSRSWDIAGDEEQWSDEQYRILGYQPGEVRASRELFEDTIHPNDRERVLEIIRNALGGEHSFSAEFQIFRSDGVVRDVWMEGAVYRNADG